MSSSMILSTHFDNTDDHSLPLLSPEQTQCENGRTTDDMAPDLLGGSDTLRNTSAPPTYRYALITDDKNNETHGSNYHAPAPTVPHSLPTQVHFVDTGAEWHSTLRELQLNLADLRAAKIRASKFSTLARIAPRCVRSRKAMEQDSACEIRVLEELVLAGMHRLARIHPDSLAQAEWDSRAEEFSRSLMHSHDGIDAGSITRLSEADEAISGDLQSARAQRFGRYAKRFIPTRTDNSLVGLSKGLAILVATPVALAGAGVFGAGAVLYGSGKVIAELGHIMTCGKLRS